MIKIEGQIHVSYAIITHNNNNLKNRFSDFLNSCVILKDFMFRKNFRCPAKLRISTKDFSCIPSPYRYIASPIINIPHQNGIFIILDEPKSIHHNQKVRSLRQDSLLVLAFHGFGQMYNDVCIIREYQSIFVTLKFFLLFILSSPTPLQTLATSVLLTIIVFVFSRMSYCLNDIVCSNFQICFFAQ